MTDPKILIVLFVFYSALLVGTIYYIVTKKPENPNGQT